MNTPRTIRDIINAPDFHPFPRSSDAWIDDPDRMERCNNAAVHGKDGSTHAETLDDWRDYAREKYREARRALDYDDEAGEARLGEQEARLDAELDALEARHEQHGTLHQLTEGGNPDQYRDQDTDED